MLKRLLARWMGSLADPTTLHPLLESYRREVEGFDGTIHDASAKDLSSGRAILALPREEQVLVLLQAVGRLRSQSEVTRGLFLRRVLQDRMIEASRKEGGLRILISALLRRRLPFSEEQIVRLAEEACAERADYFYAWPMAGVVRAFETYAKGNPMPEPLPPLLRKLVKRLRPDDGLIEWRRLAARLEAVLASDDEAAAMPLRRGDAWADRLLDLVESLPRSEQLAWHGLLSHARAATASLPGRVWTEKARQLLTTDMRPGFAALAKECLAAIGEPGSRASRDDDRRLLNDRYTDLLRGLIWCAGLLEDDNLVPGLAAAAGECFKKVRGVGPLNVKIGNACLWALAANPVPASVAALSGLRAKVMHSSTREQIDKALGAAAERLGLSPEEIEEAVVPEFAMHEVGCLRRAVGEYQAILRVRDSKTVDLRWLKPNGKEQKGVPKKVREEFPAEVKALRKLAREIKSVLPGQRDRIERLFLRQRSWPYGLWRQRYLDHALVGSLARRLVWALRVGEEETTAIWHEGELAGHDGAALAEAYDHSEVSLWHPLDGDEESVRAWRLWLYTHQVTQPFKQAHREIYLLTDAERETATYSNRFAAHILRQHQFAALCRQRGWRYSLQGEWDSQNLPHRVLEEHDLSVEFWVDPAPAESSETGVYLYLASDQVRFCDLAGEPRRLDTVPALLFSELMRDVDLFVGVASVGNDPDWVDRGEEGFDAYWRQYSFGDLSETARTRRETLERIVPRLGIADRCSFSERFLVVRGSLQIYKIHCGSSNVLIEGSGRYLCIVPGRSRVKKVERPFLPFEGDGVLAIILSKAFLLAADDQIEDPLIRGQIRR